MGEFVGVKALVATACERTGLEDFGEESFREGLERLVHSLRTEATLNDIGADVLPEMLLKHLTQRLQIEDWYRRHPEIDDEEIVATATRPTSWCRWPTCTRRSARCSATTSTSRTSGG